MAWGTSGVQAIVIIIETLCREGQRCKENFFQMEEEAQSGASSSLLSNLVACSWHVGACISVYCVDGDKSTEATVPS